MIKKIQKNMNKKGFTLVELIIVLAVMAILAAIVVPRMGGITTVFKQRADERVGASIAREIQIMIQVGEITTDATDAGADVTSSYTGMSGYVEPEFQDATGDLLITLDDNYETESDDFTDDVPYIVVRKGSTVLAALPYTGKIE